MSRPAAVRTLRVGVVSDTHGRWAEWMDGSLHGVSHIVHAGDVGSPAVLRRLGTIAPVTAVRGNCDDGELARLPARAEVVVGGVRFVVAHRERDLAGAGAEPGGATLVLVSGHTHRFREVREGGILRLNPGAIVGDHARPDEFPPGLAIVTVTDGDVGVEHVLL